MNLTVAALRLMRGRLHDRAYQLHARGHAEAAQAIWAVVEELDDLIHLIARRRR